MKPHALTHSKPAMALKELMQSKPKGKSQGKGKHQKGKE